MSRKKPLFYINMSKNITLITFAVLTLSLTLSLQVPHASATWLIDRSGSLLLLDPLVLGDNDEQEDEAKTDESSRESDKKAVEQRQEIEKKLAEQDREKAKQRLESAIKVNEIKTTKNKLERESEIEVEGDKLKIKQKTRDATGRETETQLEMGDKEELQLESRSGEAKDKIIMSPGADDSLQIERQDTRVHTKLKVRVNTSNELVVTRPDGTERTLTVLPDQAMVKLREQNILPLDDRLDTSTGSANLPDLEEENGESVYKINAQKEKRVLGLFKVSLKTRAILSAETGDLLRTEYTGFDRLLNLFSF